MSDHVFVCYARKDQEYVLPLAAALKRSGVPIWLDQWDIPAGADWDRSIDDAIYDCEKFLIVLSPNSVDSPEVRAELRTALDERKVIVPVIQAACRMPRQLRTIQYVDFSSRGPDDESLLQQLLRTLASARAVPPAVREEETADTKQSAQQPVQESTVKKAGTVFRDTLKDGSQGPEMVVIPAGKFKMGDVPVVTVKLSKPFAMGRFQVTFDEYDAFAKSTKARLPDDQGWGRGRRPVIHVSWEDAQAYIKWLSDQTGKRYRLPSESEWEYAARSGGKEETWAGTSDEKQLRDYAVFETTGTAPVGSKKPNGIGLHDMSGNVWEWVEDCWHETYDGLPTDGQAWEEENGGQCGQRVLRGGSWNGRPGFLRASDRDGGLAGLRGNFIGFRLAQARS